MTDKAAQGLSLVLKILAIKEKKRKLEGSCRDLIWSCWREEEQEEQEVVLLDLSVIMDTSRSDYIYAETRVRGQPEASE